MALDPVKEGALPSRTDIFYIFAWLWADHFLDNRYHSPGITDGHDNIQVKRTFLFLFIVVTAVFVLSFDFSRQGFSA